MPWKLRISQSEATDQFREFLEARALTCAIAIHAWTGVGTTFRWLIRRAGDLVAIWPTSTAAQ